MNDQLTLKPTNMAIISTIDTWLDVIFMYMYIEHTQSPDM
jgi:hypothetical protein